MYEVWTWTNLPGGQYSVARIRDLEIDAITRTAVFVGPFKDFESAAGYVLDKHGTFEGCIPLMEERLAALQA